MGKIKIRKKQKKLLTYLVLLIIALLLLLPPYIKNINFKLNAKEVYGVITSISPYEDREGDIYYHVTVLYEVNRELYTKTFSYGTNKEIQVNKKQKLFYNEKNPKEVTTKRDVNMEFDGIKIILGNLFFGIIFIMFLMDLERSSEDKRFNKSFAENFSDDVKLTIKISIVSVILLIFSIIFVILNPFKNTPLDSIQYFYVFWPVILAVACFFQIVAILKLRSYKEFDDLKENRFEKRIMVNNTEIYFLSNCFIDAVNGLMIRYEDIYAVDVKNNTLLILKKNGKLKTLFYVYYGKRLNNLKSAIEGCLNEITSRVPDVLTKIDNKTITMVKKQKRK